MAKTKDKKWVIYLIAAVLVIFVFGFTLRNRLIGSSSIMISPSPVPTLNLVKPKDLGLSESEYVEKAIDDLAQKLKIAREEVKLVNAEAKKWSNTSLGCPEKGRFYAEVITPGYIIVLSANGKTWEYHAGLNKVVTCTKS